MPTFNAAAPAGHTDLGWGYLQVTKTQPDTGAALAVRVTCKACLASHDLDLDAHGGIVSVFQHADDCGVYRRIRAHTVHELGRA